MITTSTSGTGVGQGSREPLPQGWKLVALGDIGPLLDGDWILNADYSASGVRLIQVGDVGKGAFIGNSSRFVSEQTVTRLGCTLLREGDILISRMPEPIGRACIFPRLPTPCITAVDVSIWRPDPTLADGRYLALCLARPDWYAEVATRASGATRARISRSNLETLKIPLPPLPIQRLLADRLGEQFAAVERARVAAEARLEAAEALVASHLRVVFADAVTAAWPRRPLRELAEIVSGITLGRKPPSGSLRSISYLRVANVKDGHLNLSEVYSIEASEAEIAKLRLRWGDLLLTEGGDRDKLGRGTFWQGEIGDCIHQNHIFRVRFDPGVVIPAFAAAQFGSPYGKAYFLSHAKQTTGIATINRRVLGDYPFLVPPRPNQQVLVDRVATDSVEAGRLQDAARVELAAINALPAALLRRAFSGEL